MESIVLQFLNEFVEYPGGGGWRLVKIGQGLQARREGRVKVHADSEPEVNEGARVIQDNLYYHFHKMLQENR